MPGSNPMAPRARSNAAPNDVAWRTARRPSCRPVMPRGTRGSCGSSSSCPPVRRTPIRRARAWRPSDAPSTAAANPAGPAPTTARSNTVEVTSTATPNVAASSRLVGSVSTVVSITSTSVFHPDGGSLGDPLTDGGVREVEDRSVLRVDRAAHGSPPPGHRRSTILTARRRVRSSMTTPRAPR